jgi:hypothetical protein
MKLLPGTDDVFSYVEIRRRITSVGCLLIEFMSLLNAAGSFARVAIPLLRGRDGISCSYFSILSASLLSIRLDRGLQLTIF